MSTEQALIPALQRFPVMFSLGTQPSTGRSGHQMAMTEERGQETTDQRD